MGCPDWPRCFGSWVPPTSIGQLPQDYLQVYKDQRIEKNRRLAGTLEKMGFTQIAHQLANNPAAHIETEFNVTKTWIEYVNRVVGVVIGFLIFLTVVFSFKYYRRDNAIIYLSVLSLVLVAFQGWLGSIVVSTNLLPETITVHMALALVMVALLIYTIARSQGTDLRTRTFTFSSGNLFFLWLAVFLSFYQILLGTQVREMIDEIAFKFNYGNRQAWIGQLDTAFYVHRSFSMLVFVVNAYLGYRLFKLKDGLLNRLIVGLIGLLVLEILFGVMLVEWDMPSVLQPLHLVAATLIFGIQFLMLIIYYYATRRKEVAPIVA
jgi:cytochrome c oxidase assembly protein subunit 15